VLGRRQPASTHPAIVVPSASTPVTERIRQIIDTITACRDYYQRIADQAEGIELRTVTNGTINLYVIRNEREGVGVPYLYSERSAESPLWRCRQGTRLYEMLGNEFEALWSKNKPPGESAQQQHAADGAVRRS
jgi:hypothetical protein